MSNELYNQLLRAIREARGANQFRGRSVEVAVRRVIRLELEAKGGLPPGPWLTIFVGDDDAWFEHEGFRHSLKACGGLEAFVEAALLVCRRGRVYIKTNDTQVDYK